MPDPVSVGGPIRRDRMHRVHAQLRPFGAQSGDEGLYGSRRGRGDRPRPTSRRAVPAPASPPGWWTVTQAWTAPAEHHGAAGRVPDANASKLSLLAPRDVEPRAHRSDLVGCTAITCRPASSRDRKSVV